MPLIDGTLTRKREYTHIWSIISSILLSELQEQGFGIHFIKSLTTEIEQLVEFSYVDDCNTVQLDDYIEATHSQMQLTIL